MSESIKDPLLNEAIASAQLAGLKNATHTQSDSTNTEKRKQPMIDPKDRHSGCSTLGYGKTKEAVLAAHALGMSIRETALRYGLTYAAVYGCYRRIGLEFKYESGRARYGSIKALVLEEHALGMTAAQIIRKHNTNKHAVYAVFDYCNLRVSKQGRQG